MIAHNKALPSPDQGSPAESDILRSAVQPVEEQHALLESTTGKLSIITRQQLVDQINSLNVQSAQLVLISDRSSLWPNTGMLRFEFDNQILEMDGAVITGSGNGPGLQRLNGAIRGRPLSFGHAELSSNSITLPIKIDGKQLAVIHCELAILSENK